MFIEYACYHDFYQTALGRGVRGVLCAKLDEYWPLLRGEKVLVLGYGVPLFPDLAARSGAVIAMMPPQQGAAVWPEKDGNIVCLAELDALPLPDASIDRVVVLHALEGLSEPAPLLREIWRVMKSGGRLLTIVANRRGLWARRDHTPFGKGQPYSAAQLKKVLNQQGFLVERGCHALYALPSGSRLAVALADRAERYGPHVCSALGGVVMIEARKQLFAPILTKERVRRTGVLPVSMPALPG